MITIGTTDETGTTNMIATETWTGIETRGTITNAGANTMQTTIGTMIRAVFKKQRHCLRLGDKVSLRGRRSDGRVSKG